MNNLIPNEKIIAQNQHSLCDRFTEQDDLVFSYPQSFLNEADAIEVAVNLQLAVNYLKSITDLNPTHDLRSRVVIRWKKNRKKKESAGWKPDRDNRGNIVGHHIDLSWDYMSAEFQPFKICAHELVHQFYRCSPLHEKDLRCPEKEDWLGNEGWGEGFCDFMRGPVMIQMNIPKSQGEKWWHQVIEKAKNNDNGTHQNPAGQFVLWYLQYNNGNENSIPQLIKDNRKLKSFICYLFNEFACRPLKSKMTPRSKMMKKFGKNKL